MPACAKRTYAETREKIDAGDDRRNEQLIFIIAFCAFCSVASELADPALHPAKRFDR